MTRHELRKSILLAGQVFCHELGRNADKLRSTCVECKLFNDAAEHCTKWNARPPARVIAYGCESFEYNDVDEIPF